MRVYETRRIVIADPNTSKPLDVRIKEMCESMSTVGYDLASTCAVEGQLLLVFSKGIERRS